MTATTGQMQNYASQVATQYGVPTDLFASVISNESSWNPSAQSGAGAIGLGQLMPDTAANLGVNPYDWQQNLTGSAKYLSQLYTKFGDWTTAVAAYHAGPGNVAKGNIGPATQDYLSKVLNGLTGGAFSQDQSATNNAWSNGMAGAAATLTAPLKWTDGLANLLSLNVGTRIVSIVLGVLFVGVAVFVLASGTKTGQTVINVAKTAALAA